MSTSKRTLGSVVVAGVVAIWGTVVPTLANGVWFI